MNIIQIPSSTTPQIIQTATGILGTLAPLIYLVIGIIAAFFIFNVLIGIMGRVLRDRRITGAVAIVQKAGYSVAEGIGIKKPKEAIELANALRVLKEAGFIVAKKEVK